MPTYRIRGASPQQIVNSVSKSIQRATRDLRPIQVASSPPSTEGNSEGSLGDHQYFIDPLGAVRLYEKGISTNALPQWREIATAEVGGPVKYELNNTWDMANDNESAIIIEQSGAGDASIEFDVLSAGSSVMRWTVGIDNSHANNAFKIVRNGGTQGIVFDATASRMDVNFTTATTGVSANGDGDNLVFDGGSGVGANVGVSFLCGTSGKTFLFFGDTDNDVGMIRYSHVDQNMIVRVETVDTMTIGATSVTYANGTALRTSTTKDDTLLLQAYDTDSAAYVTMATLTANEPSPTMVLNTAVTMDGFYIYRAGGTDVTVLDGGTGSSTAAGARSNLAAAPSTAKYIVQTADSELSAEQVLGVLGTGLVKNTTTTGVLSIGVADTDYQQPVTWGDGLAYAAPTASIDYNTTNLKITTGQLNTIQDIATASSPTFAGLTLSGLTGARLMRISAANAAASVANLALWVGGTANQITSTDDGDGTVTLSTPQNIHTAASPTFTALTVGQVGPSGDTDLLGLAADTLTIRGARNSQSHTDGFRVEKTGIASAGTAVIDITNIHMNVWFTIYVQYEDNGSLTWQGEYLAVTVNSLTAGTTSALLVRHDGSIGNFSVASANFVITRPSNGVIRLTYTCANAAGTNRIVVAARVFTLENNAIPTISIT